MTNPLQFNAKYRKISGPGILAKGRPGPDHSEPVREVRTMADTSQYSDSTSQNKTERPANTWRAIGELARAAVEKAVAKCEK